MSWDHRVGNKRALGQRSGSGCPGDPPGLVALSRGLLQVAAMDNLTHSLVGAALAEAGPRDRFALATPTLVLAANVPDVDIVSYLIAGEFAALAWRRGITHGVPALLVWPFVVALVMLGWDRYVRRRRDPAASPARFGPLLALAALGAATHPALDWLNTYGMRWWLPFDGAWSYGDSVFIIDPWLWLVLGGAVFLARSAGRRALVAWSALAALTTVPVLAFGAVPMATKVVWVTGILGFAAVRGVRALRHSGPLRPPARRRLARGAVSVAAAYVAVMIGGALVAERGARAESVAAGLNPLDVMTGPRPGRLLDRDVIVRTPSEYRTGTWRWDRSPRLALDPAPVPLRRGPDEVIERALDDPRVRHFLTWSRYPYADASEREGGWSVVVGDARYAGRGLGGLEVWVDRGPD